jgi:methionine-rich copper-binding protein CopC
VYTATFTPTADGACTIDVVAGAFTDLTGNNNTAAEQFNWTYDDTVAPTVTSFTLSDTALKAGESAGVTLVFSEAVTGFISADDITVVNGSLTNMTSGDSITWTGTYIPTLDTEDASNVLTLGTGYEDLYGNTGVGNTTANFTIDTKAPYVTSFIMSTDSLASGEPATVTLVFSEAVDGFSSDTDIDPQNGTLAAMTSSNDIMWTGTFTASSAIADTTGKLTLSTSYNDEAGNTGIGNTSTKASATNPVLATSSPANNATGVAVNSNIVLTFSEAVTQQTGTSIAIYKFSNDDVVPSTVSGSGTVITIDPTDNLDEDTQYYVKIDDDAFKDAADKFYAGINDKITLSFTTGPSPTLSSSSPADNAIGVAVDSNIVLTFSEAVDAETGGNIVIHKSSDHSVVETISVTGDRVSGSGTNVITVDPTNNLDEDTLYYVKIAATAFDDAAGNSYAGIDDTTTLSFTTAA